MQPLANEAVVAEVVPMVRDEYHDRAVGQSGRRKVVEDSPDVMVEA